MALCALWLLIAQGALAGTRSWCGGGGDIGHGSMAPAGQATAGEAAITHGDHQEPVHSTTAHDQHGDRAAPDRPDDGANHGPCAMMALCTLGRPPQLAALAPSVISPGAPIDVPLWVAHGTIPSHSSPPPRS